MRMQSRSLLSLLIIGALKSTNLHRKMAHRFAEHHLRLCYTPSTTQHTIQPLSSSPHLLPKNPTSMHKNRPPKNTNRYASKVTSQSNSQSTRIPQKSTKRPPDSKPRAASLPPALNHPRLAVVFVLFGIGVAMAVAALVVAVAAMAAAAVTVVTVAVVIVFCEMLVIASSIRQNVGRKPIPTASRSGRFRASPSNGRETEGYAQALI